MCFKAKYLLVEKNKNFECMWVYLYFSLHLLPVPNTHALTSMSTFFTLLFSAFIWFGLVFNEVNSPALAPIKSVS